MKYCTKCKKNVKSESKDICPICGEKLIDLKDDKDEEISEEETVAIMTAIGLF